MGWFGGATTEGINPTKERPEWDTQSERSESPEHLINPGAQSTSSRPPAANLPRMPSSDALNRSLHNNSGHGNKSTAQMIQDLRSANSTLVSKISTMEADFMNQVHEITSQMAERELNYKEEVKSKDMQIQTFQNRVQGVERRIRERDQQMSSLKEEKARMMHQVTDLKNQLYQLQFEIEETSADKADDAHQWEMKLTDANRALEEANKAKAEMESKADALVKEIEELKQRGSSGSSGSIGTGDGSSNKNADINELTKRCYELEQLNVDLQNSLKKSEATNKSNTDSLKEEIGNLNKALSEIQKDKQDMEMQLKQHDSDNVTENDAVIKKCYELEQLNVELQNSLKKTESSYKQEIENLRSTNKRLEEEVQNERMGISRNKQMSDKEIANLRSMLRARDDAIQSLQQRVEKGQEEMTTLEEELDKLRKDAKDTEAGKEDVGNLWRLNDEMAQIIEEQSKKVEDLTEKLEQRKKEYEHQIEIADRREEKIKELNGRLAEKEKELNEKTQLLEEQTLSLDRKRADADEETSTIDKLTRRMEECTKIAEEQAEHNSQLMNQNKSLRDQLLAHEKSIATSSSSHTRVATLEYELQQTNERMTELVQSLEESSETVSDLEAEIVFKEGRIASLEKELEEATHMLEIGVRDDTKLSPSKSPGNESGKFARLRKEIENVTRQRVKLENEHSRQLNLLENSKNAEISALEDKLGEANEAAEKIRKQLNDEIQRGVKMRQSIERLEMSEKNLSRELSHARNEIERLRSEDTGIDDESEEMQEKIRILEDEKAQLHTEAQDLRRKILDLEVTEESQCFEMTKELREAQHALIAMDKDRVQHLQESKDRIESLSEQLSESKEQIMMSDAKLNRAIREREIIISDLKNELAAKEKYASELLMEIEELQLTVEKSVSTNRFSKIAVDPDSGDPDVVSRLKVQVSTLEKEKKMIESELRSKLEDRDATIAALVVSSSNQEQKSAELKSEVNHLKILLETKSSSENMMSQQLKGLEAVGAATSDSMKKESESLKKKIEDLSEELSSTKRKLSIVVEELEFSRSALRTTKSRPDVKELASKLASSEQSQRTMKADNEEKLKERDAAISNLLQSVQANELTISSLRAEVDDLKKKMSQTLEENKRLQQESEIFAAQIIEQDEEIEGINAKLKEKSGQVSSLKKEVASAKSDLKKVDSLQAQVDELQDEKTRQLRRINDLEYQLRDAQMKKVERDGYEVERLRLQLKNAVTTKELTEEKLTKQIESIRKLRNHAVEEFEAKLRDRDSQITSLENELLELREKVTDSVFDVSLDQKQIADQNQLSELTEKCLELGEERDMLKLKIGALNQEIESLKAASSGSESKQIAELKERLEQSERMREALEKNRSISNTNKDAEIDNLRKQLAEAKEIQTSKELEQLTRLKELDKENREIRDEFSIRMKEKNAKITALEQTLAAQEQVVGNMSNEMDQLQSGMEKIAVQRRAEVEEMQQELMDYTTKATRLEREVMALSMKLDEKKLKHKGEVARLKEKISALESENPSAIKMQQREEDRRRENELNDKNSILQRLNCSLKDENEKLRGRLDAIANEKKSVSPKSSKNNDKWRNVALQEQVAVLTQRVIELEESGKATSPRNTSILQSPVMRSSLKHSIGIVTPRSASTPRASLRVNTDDDINEANEDLLTSPYRDSTPAGRPPVTPQYSTPLSSEPTRNSKSSKIGFGLRRKSSKSPKYDDASNSTTSYNF